MHPLPYRIERTSNRTSRAIFRDEEILIRLAGGLSSDAEQQHIDWLLERMKRASANHARKTLITPFQELLDGALERTVQTVMGQQLTFTVAQIVSGRTRAYRKPHGWHIVRGEKSDNGRFHRFLWTLTSTALEEGVGEAVRKISAETYREEIAEVRLKFMHSRWGRCSLGRSIALSTPLLFTTHEIFRYVVIHELAHIAHADHSRNFWRHVESAMPEYRSSVEMLRGFRIPRLMKRKV